MRERRQSREKQTEAASGKGRRGPLLYKGPSLSHIGPPMSAAMSTASSKMGMAIPLLLLLSHPSLRNRISLQKEGL
uniref:Uncharacterized protein n=1 Tax=Rhizophora mucronata TaxID=61149 RepID=A0A2P2R2A4_RHIMU